MSDANQKSVDLKRDEAQKPHAVAERDSGPKLSRAMADKLDEWWQEHMPGSPVSRNTEAWNHMMQAFEELKRRLGR